MSGIDVSEFKENSGLIDAKIPQIPFHREPDFGVTSVNYNFADLLARAGEPA